MKNDEDCCSSYYARFVTLGDAGRIARFLGKRPQEFLKFSHLSGHDRRTDLYEKRMHGYYYDLVSGGRILQLRTKKDRSCTFFREGSCAIYPARPLACRVFPFWFSGRKIIVDNNGFDCPIVCGKEPLTKNPSHKEIGSGISKIGYSRKQLGRQFVKLRMEMDDYKRNMDSFVRKNGI